MIEPPVDALYLHASKPPIGAMQVMADVISLNIEIKLRHIFAGLLTEGSSVRVPPSRTNFVTPKTAPLTV